MKKILLISGLVALTLSSCSQEEVLDRNLSNQDANSISFRVRSNKHTRSQEYATGNLDKFMVYGFKGWPEDNYEEGVDLIPYFEQGKPVLFSDNGSGLFTSNPVYYYPADGSWVYFAAYAPTTLNMETLPYGGLTLKNFTVDSDITKQLDIICDNGGSNLEPDESDMEFIFKHALTKVFVSRIINSDTRYKYEIAGVKIGNISNSGEFIYRGEKVLTGGEDDENGVVDENGYVNDPVGDGFYWKAGNQTEEMVYLFDEPFTLTDGTVYPMSGNDSGAEDEVGFQDGKGKGAFMLIPQQLNHVVADEETEKLSMEEGVSYIAFLVKITYLPTNEVIYPYAEGVEAISQEIEGETYAWAAFPVKTLWRPGTYVDYAVTLSDGAGYVAPGAEEEYQFKPILGREIRFTEEVQFWPNYNDSSFNQNGEIIGDGTNTSDPFGDDPFGE